MAVLGLPRHLATSLVDSASAHVTDPLDDVVIRVVQLRFEHFQVSDLKNNVFKNLDFLVSRKITLNPLGAKGTSKLMLTGGRSHRLF